jgi:hypothetical protein
MSFIAPLIGAGASLLGSGKGAAQQNQSNAAAQQASQAQTQLYQAEGGDIDQLMQQYLGTTVPGENTLSSYLTSNLGGTMSNPYASSAATTAGQLQNFTGLQPAELAALQTTLGNSGLSTARTFQSQAGSGANNNRLMQSLYNQNNLNALNSTTQLGGLGAEQEEGALASAGGIQSGLSGQNVDYQQGIASLLNSLFGTQTGTVDSSLGGLNTMAAGYGAAGANAAANGAAAGSAAQTGLLGLGTNLATLFGGSTAPVNTGTGLQIGALPYQTPPAPTYTVPGAGSNAYSGIFG